MEAKQQTGIHGGFCILISFIIFLLTACSPTCSQCMIIDNNNGNLERAQPEFHTRRLAVTKSSLDSSLGDLDLPMNYLQRPEQAITPSALRKTLNEGTINNQASRDLYSLVNNQGCFAAVIQSGSLVVRCSHLNSSNFNNPIQVPSNLEIGSNNSLEPLASTATTSSSTTSTSITTTIGGSGNNSNGGGLIIHELHIADTEQDIIPETMDSICGGSQFDCTGLKVLNLTRVKVDKQKHKIKEWIRSFTRLNVLELSWMHYDSLDTFIPEPYSLPNLVNLFMDGNNLTFLDFDQIMSRWPDLNKLNANNNSISQIRCTDVKTFTWRFKESSLGIVHNNLTCDKNLLWLIRLFVRKDYIFSDMDQIRCDPEKGTELTWQQWINVLETKICDTCDCHSLKKTAIGVNCHNRTLTSLPEVLPPYTKVLNLTSNRIRSLSLPLGSKNWPNVTYVHIDNNLVTSIKAIETNLKLMKNLVALDMRKNKLQEFPIHILEQFNHLDQVHLSDNPWLCDCNTISFQGWLQRHFRKVRDMEHIKCGIEGSDENGVKSMHNAQRLSSRVIYRLSKSELCPQPNEPINWLDFVNVALAATITVIILKVIMDYFYQQRTSKLPRFFKLNI